MDQVKSRQSANSRQQKRLGSEVTLVGYAPMVIFSVVYVLTCLLGALLLLVDYRPFAGLFEYFSGFHAPRDRSDLVPIQLALLVLAPTAMWFGYAIGTRVPAPRGFVAPAVYFLETSELHTPSWLPQVVFYLLASLAFLSLTQVGLVGDMRIWLDPQAALDSRYRAFRALSFFEFVNIYTLVPIAAAWVVVTMRGNTLRTTIIRWLPLVAAVALCLLLYQKRPALNSLILVGSATILAMGRTDPQRARKTIVAAIAAIVVVYLALVLVPAYFQTSVPRPPSPPTATGDYPVTPTIGALPSATSAPEVVESGRTQGILLYAILGPLNRTSNFALFYPVVFPELHDFYGLDLGQDMLGKLPWFHVARMPDDNVVVWDYLASAMPGGRVAAPFQFVLYSQVGLAGALVGSVVFGLGLALGWRAVQSPRIPPAWASLGGALFVLLSIFVAMDSARNSLLVSYGVVWGLIFVIGAMVLVTRLNGLRWRRTTRSRTAASP